MQAIERQLTHQNWVTLVLLFALILLTILKFYKPKRFFGFFTAFFSSGFIENILEEKPTFFSGIHGVLLFFSTIIFSLTISIIIFFEAVTLPIYLMVFLGTFLYISSHNLVDFLLEKIIHTEEQTRYFRFTKLGYLYTTALWMFPFFVIYQFGYQNIYILVNSLGILLLIRIILIIVNNKNLIFSNLFYFILYLCALEIAPLLILYKLVMV